MTATEALGHLLRGRWLHAPECDCPWCEAIATLLAAAREHDRAEARADRAVLVAADLWHDGGGDDSEGVDALDAAVEARRALRARRAE